MFLTPTIRTIASLVGWQTPCYTACRFLSQGIGLSMPSSSSLEDVMKVDILRGKSREEVEEIWLEYHSDESKSRIATVLDAQDYRTLEARSKLSPMFVLPLGKPGGGSLTLMLQYQLPHLLITTVEEYKRLEHSAPAHLSLTYYPQLEESKGVVLVRGDVISPQTVSVPEARTLMALTHAFYLDPVSHLDVHNFNHNPEQFSYEYLLYKLGHKVT